MDEIRFNSPQELSRFLQGATLPEYSSMELQVGTATLQRTVEALIRADIAILILTRNGTKAEILKHAHKFKDPKKVFEWIYTFEEFQTEHENIKLPEGIVLVCNEPTVTELVFCEIYAETEETKILVIQKP